MTHSIKLFQNNQIRVRDDGYFSATDMCQVCGKFFADWKRLNATNEYLEALSQAMRNPITSLVQVIQGIPQGGTPQDQGTWVHRRVAIRLAQWLSPEFAVQVDAWVEEMLLNKAQIPVNPSIPVITDSTIAIHLEAITTFQNNGDLQLASLLKSRFGNLLLAEQQNLLPGSNNSVNIQLEGAIEVAIRLGISVPKNYEGALGKYVKSRCAHLLQGKNERFSLASEKVVPANMYPKNNEEVEKAVLEFAAMKSLRIGN